jgi:membrane-anchored mycosin MYCP
MLRRLTGILGSLVLLTGALVIGAGAPALAAPDCADPGQPFGGTPWPQVMFSPERIWPLTRGQGMSVAVLDSGVDAGTAGLSGHVAGGFDAAAGSGSANNDCVGSGTQIASVIAGQTLGGTAFSGLAPSVTILPVRVIAERPFAGGATVSPQVLAKGINWAIGAHATVIDVAVAAYGDDPQLKAAVAAAIAAKIPVIAAVGDQNGANAANPTPYPAAYPGVIGVGAIDQTGVRWTASQAGSYVDLVAPGAAVPAMQRGGGFTSVDGTGIASGFVAATAALVRAQKGDIGVEAMTRQLTATATASLGGSRSAEYGAGIVSPESAVTEQLVGGPAQPLPGMLRPNSEAASIWADRRTWAAIGTAGAAALALLVFALAYSIPRARRRNWRAGQAAAPKVREEPEEPGPPVMLFD